MGSGSSSTHCVNLEFLEKNRKEDFLQTLGQCAEKERVPITKDILKSHPEVENFVLVTKGQPTTPRLWHSKNIFVCAITTPKPPIKEFECAYHQYHSLPFMSIRLDAISHCHLLYFMNRVRFFLGREELLERVLKLKSDYDDMLAPFITEPRLPPLLTPPIMTIAVPYSLETGGEGAHTMNYKTVVDGEQKMESSSFAPEVSEPSSVIASSSFAPPISEPVSISSSVMDLVSEPSSMMSSIGNSTSSMFVPVSEPVNLEFSSSATSFFGEISEPSSILSANSSILDPFSEPSGMLSSGWNSGESSQFGLISDISETGYSGLSSQFGLVSDVSENSAASGMSSQFGIVSDVSTEEGSSGMSSQFGIISEPTGINSGTDLYSVESVSEPPPPPRPKPVLVKRGAVKKTPAKQTKRKSKLAPPADETISEIVTLQSNTFGTNSPKESFFSTSVSSAGQALSREYSQE